MRLYHGTQASRVDAIRRDGLKAPESVNPWTWYMLTTSFEQAARYAMGDHPVVIEFDIPDDQLNARRGGWLGIPSEHNVYGFEATAYGIPRGLPPGLIVAVHPVAHTAHMAASADGPLGEIVDRNGDRFEVFETVSGTFEARLPGGMRWQMPNGDWWQAVAYLQVYPSGEVEWVSTENPYQRQGIATALWNFVKTRRPDLHHSKDQTDDGAAWAATVAAKTAGQQLYFHVGRPGLGVGTELIPGGPGGRSRMHQGPVRDEELLDWVWLSQDAETAIAYALYAQVHFNIQAAIYLARPNAKVEERTGFHSGSSAPQLITKSAVVVAQFPMLFEQLRTFDWTSWWLDRYPGSRALPSPTKIREDLLEQWRLAVSRGTPLELPGIGVVAAGSITSEAAWRDVRNKAREIRSGGGVKIIAAAGDQITAEVKSTTGSVYQTSLLREPGTKSVAMWECSCPWSAYSWGRSGRWKKYEGRMCAHALALVYEAQAQEWGGNNVTEGPGHGEDITFYEAPPPGEWRLDAPVRTGPGDLAIGASLRIAARSERSGVPEVDRVIEEFLAMTLTDGLPVCDLRDPANAHGACQSVTEEFVELATRRGLRAYVTPTTAKELGYRRRGRPAGEVLDDSGDIVAGFYDEHVIASVYVDGQAFPIEIDFTAAQYGYKALPKVRASVSDRVLDIGLVKAASQATRAYRGAGVPIDDFTEAQRLLHLLADGNTSAAAQIVLHAVSNATRESWWDEGADPGHGLGTFWSTDRHAAYSYSRMEFDVFTVPVLFEADADDTWTPFWSVDGQWTSWWHLPLGHPVNLRRATAELPTAATARSLLDAIASQGQWATMREITPWHLFNSSEARDVDLPVGSLPRTAVATGRKGVKVWRGFLSWSIYGEDNRSTSERLEVMQHELPQNRALAQRFHDGTVTADDLLKIVHLNSAGIYWAEAGPHPSEGGRTGEEVARSYAGGQRGIVPGGGGVDETQLLAYSWGEDDHRGIGTAMIVLVAELDEDAAGFDGEGMLELDDGQPLNLLEIQYNAGWGWRTVPIGGRRITASLPDRPLYHGSFHELADGTMLRAGAVPGNWDNQGSLAAQVVWMTDDPDDAMSWARQAAREMGVDPELAHVYEVEPVGEVRQWKAPAHLDRMGIKHFTAESARVLARTAKADRFDGVSLKQDDDGWYVTTHRARSDSYESPEAIPQADIDFIESTGSLRTAGRKKLRRGFTIEGDQGLVALLNSSPAAAAREIVRRAERFNNGGVGTWWAPDTDFNASMFDGSQGMALYGGGQGGLYERPDGTLEMPDSYNTKIGVVLNGVIEVAPTGGPVTTMYPDGAPVEITDVQVWVWHEGEGRGSMRTSDRGRLLSLGGGLTTRAAKTAGVGTIYRGLRFSLDPYDYYQAMAEGRWEDAARMIVEGAQSNSGGLGAHWTLQPDVAWRFAAVNSERTVLIDPGSIYAYVSAVIEATYESDQIEYDPNKLDGSQGYGWEGKEEYEVPLKRGAQLNILAVHLCVPQDLELAMTAFNEGDQKYQLPYDVKRVPLPMRATAKTAASGSYYHLTDKVDFQLNPLREHPSWNEIDEHFATQPKVASHARPDWGLDQLDLPEQAYDGDCLLWSPYIVEHLQARGVEAHVVTVLGYLAENLLAFAHQAVLADGLVVDATATQFNSRLDPLLVLTPEEYRTVLGEATGTTIEIQGA